MNGTSTRVLKIPLDVAIERKKIRETDIGEVFFESRTSPFYRYRDDKIINEMLGNLFLLYVPSPKERGSLSLQSRTPKSSIKPSLYGTAKKNGPIEKNSAERTATLSSSFRNSLTKNFKPGRIESTLKKNTPVLSQSSREMPFQSLHKNPQSSSNNIKSKPEIINVYKLFQSKLIRISQLNAKDQSQKRITGKRNTAGQVSKAGFQGGIRAGTDEHIDAPLARPEA